MGKNVRLSAAAIVVCSVGVLPGCAYPEPYVHAYREFDRSSPEFRREPPDRAWVTVCARPFRGSDATTATLAEETCQKHGKTAVEAARQFGVCPMLLASAIVYRCTSPTS